MNKNIRYLWFTIAAILSLFIGSKWNIPLAAWIAPVFFIRFFRSSEKAGRNFLLMWGASAAATIISWNKATATAAIHPYAEPVFFLLVAPIGLLPYVIDRMAHRRFGTAAWMTLVFPVAATAMDYFSASGSPFGSFGAGGYSQRGFEPVMQAAAVSGLWGITFLASWFASLANHVWENHFKFTRLSLSFTVLIALALGAGFARPMLSSGAEQTVQVAGFSLPAGQLSHMLDQLNSGDEAGFRSEADKIHEAQLEQIRIFVEHGAQIVVLQEGAGMGMSDQVEAFIAEASAIAKDSNVYIVLPTFDFGKTPAENKVHIIDPEGKIVLTHVKYGGSQFEGSLPGDRILQTVDTPYGKLSAVICWDADFPDVMRQAGQLGVDLMFVPSNDWFEVKDIHAGMASFRAVENGMAIFRQTGQGVSSVFDVYGHEVNRVDAFEKDTDGFTGLQSVSVPLGSAVTLYPVIGDLFGDLMLLGLVVILAGLFITRKRTAV